MVSSIPPGGPSRLHIITTVVHVAEWLSLPPDLLLSIAYGESEFNLWAVGDNGTSAGLFQCHVPAHGHDLQYWMGLDGARRTVEVMFERWVAQYAPADPFWKNWAHMQGADPTHTKANEQRALVGGTVAWSEYQARKPLPPVPHRVTLPYDIKDGATYGTATRPHAHRGIDYGCPVGTHVLAIGDGDITWTGYDASGGFGNVVWQKLDSGPVVGYAHLHEVRVSIGQRLLRGGLVGRSGETGDTTGPHLHLQGMVQSQPVDLIPWILGEGGVITPEPPQPGPYLLAKVGAKDGLNIRSGPGKEHQDIGDLSYGETVWVYDRDYQGTGWARIEGGYAASWWLDYAPEPAPPPPPVDTWQPYARKLEDALTVYRELFKQQEAEAKQRQLDIDAVIGRYE